MVVGRSGVEHDQPIASFMRPLLGRPHQRAAGACALRVLGHGKLANVGLNVAGEVPIAGHADESERHSPVILHDQERGLRSCRVGGLRDGLRHEGQHPGRVAPRHQADHQARGQGQ